MTRSLLHTFGVCWVVSYIWMLSLYPVDPAYEVLSLLVVFSLWRVWRTLREVTL